MSNRATYRCICGCWYAACFVEGATGIAARCSCCLRQTGYRCDHQTAWLEWNMMQFKLRQQRVR